MQLTKHFHFEEFISQGDEHPPGLDEIENLKLLAQRLQAIRDIVKSPIIITSGYRSPKYNKQIGGAKNSFHCKGMAADIQVVGWNPSEVQEFLQEWSGGLGSYKTFTHVDIREGHNARWHG